MVSHISLYPGFTNQHACPPHRIHYSIHLPAIIAFALRLDS